MGRRLLSHLLITLAIFSLSMTFFIWVIDMTVLTPTNLTKALRDGGVPSAIANVIPEQAAKGEEEDNCQNGPQNMQQSGQPGIPQNTGCEPKVKTEQDKREEAEMRAKIAAVVTPDYVDQKLSSVVTSLIGYIKNGSPNPVIDLSDFPAKLRENGVNVGEDIDKSFSKPIELTFDTVGTDNEINLSFSSPIASLPKFYRVLNFAKYIGIALCVLLLTAEWFAAAKGDKMHLMGRIFLHVAFWYTVWWGVLVIVPNLLLPRLKNSIQGGDGVDNLIDALSKSVQGLLSKYFLSFAIVCWIVAIALYAIRHARKHVDKIQSVPAAKGKAKPLPNKR
jgi:hypothetical protein